VTSLTQLAFLERDNYFYIETITELMDDRLPRSVARNLANSNRYTNLHGRYDKMLLHATFKGTSRYFVQTD